ncbi:formyltransferase family protein [Lachnoclostridium sp. An118]|uniref:formyltransferase family protein n=1 Tax=Lachnoclostridium sp. An118 TaxID=1965547 RepID=UPI0013A618CB|nr:formyltransferase family protein [Lachnoclostridium sp. An118]
MNTIHFIGVSDGLKPFYILEELFQHKTSLEGKKIYFITDTKQNDGKTEKFCQEHNITVLKLEMDCLVNDTELIHQTNPEILISIGWSKIIPEAFLKLFRYAINCHGGLLPDYRGNNVYMHNYANLSSHYGVTIHYMNSRFDDGNIILQARAKLFLEESPLIIHRRICEMTALILPEAIHLVESGYLGEPQKGMARYFYKIDRLAMENLRQKNIENLRAGKPLEIAKCKEWKL